MSHSRASSRSSLHGSKTRDSIAFRTITRHRSTHKLAESRENDHMNPNVEPTQSRLEQMLSI
jgi:hypothetical protein